MLPYDYHVLWSSPANKAAYFDLQETNLKILHASPPLIARILNIAIGTGLTGFVTKLYKPSEANLLFDGASLILYMVGVVVYLTNIVKGLRTVTAGVFGPSPVDDELMTREDSLRVMAASNTILALVLVGVLVLQAGQWYALRKDESEVAEFKKRRAEEKVKGNSKKKN
jgi:hypothetical protein